MLEQEAEIKNTYFTEYTKNRFLAHLQNGASEKTARMLLRIPEGTFYRWMKKAESELLDYETWEGTEDQTELGEYATFLLAIECAKAAHAHQFRMQVHSLYLEDTRYGPILLRLMESEHQDYYGKKSTAEVKTETKIQYEITTVNGDAWKNRRLSDGKVSEVETSQDILEATYADTK
jgi:hypothetical protein